MEFLGKLSFTNDEMNSLLAWMEDNQADGEIVSIYFLKNFEDKWSKWVSDDMAAKIKAAVADM